MLDGNLDVDAGLPDPESDAAEAIGERRIVDTGTGESVDALRLGAAEVYAIVKLVRQIPSCAGTVTNSAESTGT